MKIRLVSNVSVMILSVLVTSATRAQVGGGNQGAAPPFVAALSATQYVNSTANIGDFLPNDVLRVDYAAVCSVAATAPGAPYQMDVNIFAFADETQLPTVYATTLIGQGETESLEGGWELTVPSNNYAINYEVIVECTVFNSGAGVYSIGYEWFIFNTD